ncbi:unnamed protein product [Durusdinium trenchii]|uniref:VPS10 domain-containing protein n=1 Tax=Durusdinium trenchii TaxID=1381693 RepID=A0ABP0JII4_9DINO
MALELREAEHHGLRSVSKASGVTVTRMAESRAVSCVLDSKNASLEEAHVPSALFQVWLKESARRRGFQGEDRGLHRSLQVPKRMMLGASGGTTLNEGQCTRFAVGGYFAELRSRLRSSTCVVLSLESKTTVRVTTQRFYSEANCLGLPYQTFRVDPTTTNVTQVDYLVNDKCGGDNVRIYVMSVGYCYELYPDRAPRSFKWEAIGFEILESTGCNELVLLLDRSELVPLPFRTSELTETEGRDFSEKGGEIRRDRGGGDLEARGAPNAGCSNGWCALAPRLLTLAKTVSLVDEAYGRHGPLHRPWYEARDAPAEKKEVLVKELVLDSAVVDIVYLGQKHECLLLTTKKQRLYSSCDSGQSWHEITDKVDTTPSSHIRVEKIIVNSADKTVAVLQTQRRVDNRGAGVIDPASASAQSWHPYIFISEDSGRTWRKAWGRHHGLHSWIPHPTRRSWALVSWWNGACSKASGGEIEGASDDEAKKAAKDASKEGDPDKDKPCMHRLMLTTDLGKTFLQIAPYVVQFSWGSPKINQSDRIYYTAYASKTGDQGKLSQWSTEVDFKAVDLESLGRPKVPVTSVKHGNKFMISNEFILVAKVSSEERQTVNLMVSSDGAKTWKAALLPSGMGELEEKWYTIVDTSEGAVLLHLNSETGAADTGRIFVSDSEGYKYSQSLLHNIRSSAGDVEFDKVVSLTGVYLANVLADAEGDAGYQKGKQWAVETVEQDASEGSSVDRRHGRGWGKASRTAKEERSIRTVISFDKGGSWRYLKPPKVNSQGQPYFCAGRPLQDQNVHSIFTEAGKVSHFRMVKKKIDPADGCTYSLVELQEHYAGKYKKKEIQKYWENDCKAVDEGREGAKPVQSQPRSAPRGEEQPKPSERPRLARSRSWLKKVCGVALLPCEEELAPLLEAVHASKDDSEKEAWQLKLLTAHPFVERKVKEVPAEALAPGVSVEVENFRLMVFKFRKWLKTPEGRAFEEKGKGFDDGLYLTSALLRKFLPRGYTHFRFTRNALADDTAEPPVHVVLRGFFKFTGLTAADEDEESKATEDASAFLFQGYSMDDAQRFLVTTKSNGENGKYTFRRIFGDWYCFAGSKNTGHTWKLGASVAELFPVPQDAVAAVAPKIIAFVDRSINSMVESERAKLLEAVDRRCVTIMIELNDEAHEHIFPIERSWLDHVAVLERSGFPWPQQEAFDFFDSFGLQRVTMEPCSDMQQLPKVMEEIRKSTTTEGAVLYLERSDGTAVGLLKVKSDHYVVARRTRETLRSCLVTPASEKIGQPHPRLEESMAKVTLRLDEGMKALTHVATWSADAWPEWSLHALAFAKSWKGAFENSDTKTRRALVIEFHNKFGSLYDRFGRTQEVLPLSSFSLTMAENAGLKAICSSPVSAEDEEETERRDRGAWRRFPNVTRILTKFLRQKAKKFPFSSISLNINYWAAGHRDKPHSTCCRTAQVPVLCVQFEPEETSTFFSRDGGLTWVEAHKGAFIYEFGDHGGLIVMADDLKKTGEVIFTWNEGESWYDFKVTNTPFEVDNIITEPNLTSTTFVMFGTREDGAGVLYYLKFDSLQFPACRGSGFADSVSSDYETWTASDGRGAERCMLGQQITYTRRKRTSQCWNGEAFERPTVKKTCACTEADYACDVGFVRQVGSTECVFGGLEMMPERRGGFGRRQAAPGR